jgi:hypothetical protein
LEALDRQRDAIELGSAGDVAAHVELEEQIVADIFAIQKVINPLEEMYQALSPQRGSFVPEIEGELPDLKSSLELLRAETAARSGRNRELLSRRMTALNDDILALRAQDPYRGSRSIYGGLETASMVDLQG